jgi:hypothetical protein
MPSKFTLNLKNLQALGADRLAQIVLDLAAGDAGAQRRLRMELTSDESPSKLSNNIRKRLGAIANSDRYLGWRSLKSFVADLDTQRQFIRDRIGSVDLSEAIDLAWLFLSLSTSVLERITDASGQIMAIFQHASVDIVELADQVPTLAEGFNDKLFEAVQSNYYGQSDSLITGLSPRLGANRLIELRDRLRSDRPQGFSEPARGRQVSRWTRGRVFERETIPRRSADEMTRSAEGEIADALGDVDTYISLQSDLNASDVIGQISIRLTKAGRAMEALEWLERADRGGTATVELGKAKIAALIALDRNAEAQVARWKLFMSQLDTDALRDHLKALPDFDDVEAEERAFAHAAAFPDADKALAFFINWPSLDQANQLILRRIDDIDARDARSLQDVAQRMTARYPLAALLLLRHVLAALLQTNTPQSRELAGHIVKETSNLAPRITDWHGYEDQVSFVARLKKRFGSAFDFWRSATFAAD